MTENGAAAEALRQAYERMVRAAELADVDLAELEQVKADADTAEEEYDY